MKKNILVSGIWLFALLLNCALAGQQSENEGPAGRLAQEIARLEKDSGGTIGVGSMHIESGQLFFYNRDVRFPMASAYKLPIAVQLLARAEKGEISLSDMINVEKSDLHPGSGTISKMLNQPGVVLSLRNLLELMLVASDNSATDLCIRSAGGAAAVTRKMRELRIDDIDVSRSTFVSIANSLGITVFKEGDVYDDLKALQAMSQSTETARELAWRAFLDDPRDTATPAAMAELLRKIWNREALNPESSQLLLDIMKRCQTGDGRIRGLLPPKTVVFNKTGTIHKAMNDAGIVRLPGDAGHFVAVIFVKGTKLDNDESERTIAHIARSLYDYFLFRGGDKPKDALLGVWQGTMQTKIGPLDVYFEIESASATPYLAKLTIPAQKVRAMPVQEVRFTAPGLVLDMSSFGIVFEGRMAADAESIAGAFKAGPDAMDLILRRSVAGVPEMGRPQDPKKPYPYEEVEVRVPNREAGLNLSGTLTIPAGPGPFPAVVLVSGSGPQDRDSTIAGHRPFLVWADALTRRGIAVLRCDDRGVGKSEGDFHRATTADFASDAQAAWEFLKSQPRIDGRKIGFIGHSEGGLIAPMVAARNTEAAFLVLLAGTGIRGDRLLLMQLEDSARSRGAGPEAVRKEALMNERLLQAIKDHDDYQEAEADFKRIVAESLAGMTEAEKKELKASESSVLSDWKELAADYPWARFIASCDPATALRKVRCPVLALTGDKDTQVRADVNLAEIERALKEAGNTRYDIKKLPGLNHLFQTAQTGQPREYAKIDETISPEVLKLVGDWILRLF